MEITLNGTDVRMERVRAKITQGIVAREAGLYIGTLIDIENAGITLAQGEYQRLIGIIKALETERQSGGCIDRRGIKS